MKQIEIAKKHGVSPEFVSDVRNGRKKTSLVDLARDIASITGRKPIEYIPEKIREAYVSAWPDLAVGE
jgi:transcriptional regulator with XRE-family HTH domain